MGGILCQGGATDQGAGLGARWAGSASFLGSCSSGLGCGEQGGHRLACAGAVASRVKRNTGGGLTGLSHFVSNQRVDSESLAGSEKSMAFLLTEDVFPGLGQEAGCWKIPPRRVSFRVLSQEVIKRLRGPEIPCGQSSG